MMAPLNPNETLTRQLHLGGAVLMGLGSIVGTGVFVSIGIAAGITGPSVVFAIALAAVVATCNALSSAQLAANLPVSGGTYEYGYHYLNPAFGFAAGWMFLCAKTASAATAALGFSGYLLVSLGVSSSRWQTVIGLVTVALLMLIVLQGIQRSNRANQLIVGMTLVALLAYIVAAIPQATRLAATHLESVWPEDLASFWEATALMFVAYTGYGRIATLGEEVAEPRRTIPQAIIVTLIVSALLYVAVALVSVAAVGAEAMSAATGENAAPLEVISRQIGQPRVSVLVAIGAMTAMLGVLLNLLLGLSRVLLAMGRRGDMPPAVALLNQARTTPSVAVIVIAVAIAAFTAIGSVKMTWSFSAFTVLIYYAVTNLAAWRLPKANRLYPRWIAGLGLVSCLFLAFWVEVWVWGTGFGLMAIGFILRAVFRKWSTSSPLVGS